MKKYYWFKLLIYRFFTNNCMLCFGFLLIFGSNSFCQKVVGILSNIDSSKVYQPKDPISEPHIEKIYPNPDATQITLGNNIYSAIITEGGDTLILADLDDISITTFRIFSNNEERKKYEKIRRYAIKVFPYAKEAIRIFREVEFAKKNLKKKKYKKEIKRLENELKDRFQKPLTKLTKLQGKIMIKMIEKELDQPMFTLIKNVKGRFAAFYWNQFSKLYSYNLKEGYQYGKYKILDAVLQDFDISYRIENETNLKYISLDDFRKKYKKQ